MREFIMGLFYLLAANDNKPPIVGTCDPNGAGDMEAALRLGSTFSRIPWDVAEDFSKNVPDRPYFITIGHISQTDREIADDIIAVSAKLARPPVFWAITNEENDFSFERVEQIRALIPGYTIVKGSHKAAVESATRPIYKEYFSGERMLDSRKDLPHLLHFYLAPIDQLDNKLENFKRKVYLAYIVRELQKRGYYNIIIDEAHDGSPFKEGFEDQGDFVYASGKGFKQIHKLCSDLSVSALMYYQNPYPHYKGNTMFDWQNQ